VQQLCRLALGLEAGDPLEIINSVLKRLSQKGSDVPWAESNVQIILPLRGPYHLARLLHHTAEVLLASIVTGTDTPGGIDPVSWSQFTSSFARQRPFLWRNHLKAIEEGFLETGTSFVLTFPTGAGKTTITELRIAAELIRGRSVVYLAPTRALVDQVANELSRTVRPIANDVVRGRFLEDFGESAGGKVFVQTPEQCLAYLSYDTEAHQDLGLIVVDECHQLSCDSDPPNEVRVPGKRSVDAMWTLLSLINRSSDADIVLISAMVRNGSELASWLENVTARPCKLLDLSWKPTRQIRGAVAYDRNTISDLEKKLERRKRSRGNRSGNPGVADKAGIDAIPIGLFCHTQVWNDESTYSIFPLLKSAVSLGVGATWKLSANRNQIAGQLLEGMASAGMRPIVFSQQINWTSSIANEGALALRGTNVTPTVLTQHEEDLFLAAAQELGDSMLVERPVENKIALHHGLLLLQERLAMESAFRRPDGLVALVATPTVAQGINLPAEAVIIAGDDRWVQDSEEGGPEALAVHELLNAAGRAGRAGHFAHGIVIDLPGKVFSIDNGENGFSFDEVR
jgi:replicative superfamily II helicase